MSNKSGYLLQLLEFKQQQDLLLLTGPVIRGTFPCARRILKDKNVR